MLIADKTSSVYEEGLTSQSNAVESGSNSFSIGGYFYTKIYQKKENPGMIYLETNTYSQNKKENDFILDSLPEMNWVISSVEKNIEIQGFKCREATLKFRGSTFVAYFTDEIPVSFGPWKFSGLPGLILKISSRENPTIKWEATQITYPYETKETIEFDKSKFTLSLVDAVQSNDKENDEKGRAFAAKRGSAYHPIPDNMRREMARERKYEWETW